jgi:hypothetical protein
MHVEEFIIGFDIRYPTDDMDVADSIAVNFSYVKEPRAFDTGIWPSMFQHPLP